jgi:hypothetical protein
MPRTGDVIRLLAKDKQGEDQHDADLGTHPACPAAGALAAE